MSLNQVNQFACEHCRDDRDFEQDEFQSIEDAVRRVREQVSLITVCAFFVTTYSGTYARAMYVLKQTLKLTVCGTPAI